MLLHCVVNPLFADELQYISIFKLLIIWVHSALDTFCIHIISDIVQV